MRPILIISCAAVLMGGASVAAIATGQTTTAVNPPATATPDTTQADRTDPDPGGDVNVANAGPAPDAAAAAPAATTPPVDTRAVTNEEMSVAVEEAAFDTSLSAMAAQLDGHLNGLPGDDAASASATPDPGPSAPPLAAIITAAVCIIGAGAALFFIVRSGIEAKKKQREDERQRRRALRRQHKPHKPEGDAPSA